MIIHRVSNVVQLIDPISKNKNGPLVEIDASVYWKYEFKSICTINDLVDYIILDVEIDESCPRKGKFQMATMTIARKSDFGVNDKTFEVRSHLGNVLHPGDHASGYHIVTLNANSDELDETRATEPHNIPEIILVKKLYPSRKNRSKKRVFKLQELEKEDEEGEYGERKSSQKKREQEEAMEHDRELFLQEIEEDPEIRGLINLYARHEVTEDQQADDEGEEEDEEDGFPEIKLDELLDELKLQ
jgi:nonsense-mediated mRNA decay protein 3